MQATFYTFSKKENSTKRPSGGTTKTINLKAGCSAISPTITLEWAGGGSPVAWNYLHIPEFGRFYYIDNWMWENRLWTAQARVDVLASWKNEIGGASKYILRAASDVDDKVIDTMWPAKMPSLSYTTSLVGLAWASQLQNGSFIISVVGKGNGFTAAGAGYYVIDWTDIQRLVDECFTETDNQWSGVSTLGTTIGEVMAEYGDKLTKSIQNPGQFINSLMWLPFKAPTTGTGPNPAIRLGRTTTGIEGRGLSDPVYIQRWTAETIPAAGSADWENMAPYAEYTLVIPPFGVFEIDPGRLISGNVKQIRGTIYTDCITGQAYMEVADDSGNIMFSSSAMLGIPLSLSGASVDYGAMIQQTAQAAGGFLHKLFTGNVAGAITGGVSDAVGVAQASAPHAYNGGVGGGLAAMAANRGLITNIYPHVDEDVPDKGRPVMGIRQISTLSGYVLCNDGEITAPATKNELEQISRYLTGGFYYE